MPPKTIFSNSVQRGTQSSRCSTYLRYTRAVLVSDWLTVGGPKWRIHWVRVSSFPSSLQGWKLRCAHFHSIATNVEVTGLRSSDTWGGFRSDGSIIYIKRFWKFRMAQREDVTAETQDGPQLCLRYFAGLKILEKISHHFLCRTSTAFNFIDDVVKIFFFCW